MSRILIVDDVSADRRLAGGLLSKNPRYEIGYAVNGRDALEQFEREPADIVLTDLRMPDFDGLQLVAELKKRSPGTPVVLMTANGSKDTALEAIKQGACSYIPSGCCRGS